MGRETCFQHWVLDFLIPCSYSGYFLTWGPPPCISPKNVASQFHLYDYILLVYVLHILYIYIYIQLCTYNISPYFYLHLLRYSPKSNADATAALALVKKEEEDATKVIEPWTNEPETLEELMDKYIVEAKFPGRNHGSTMFLVQSKARDGSSHQIIQGQKYKLFVATRLVYHSFGCSPHKMFSYQC